MKVSLLFTGFSLVLASYTLLYGESVEAEVGNVGEQVVAKLQVGERLSDLGIFHSNYQHDAIRVALLQGCKYSVLPATRPVELHIDWICPESKNSVFTRIYLPEGKLSRLEFLPSISQMKPSNAGPTPAMLSQKHIHKKFKEAVRSGSDPTLGGLIPISSEDLEQLKMMKGWVVFDDDQSGEYGAETFWFDKKNYSSGGVETTIHFNKAGIPVGLWMSTSSIITSVISSDMK